MKISSETPLYADDDNNNFSNNESFSSVLEARLSRRSLLKGSFGLAAAAFIGPALSACSSDDDSGPVLDFEAIAKSRDDAVHVPAGYTASVLYRLGDPIAAGVPAYRNDGTDTSASHAQRAGDHHDGMYFFGMGADGRYNAASSDRGLLVMNHEAITPAFLHPAGQTTVNGVRTVADEVVKEFYVHGVSVIEVNRSGTSYSYNQSSTFNRRIHTLTDMTLSGPAGGKAAMITRYSPDGTKTRGTVNNCANGYTPWGTYLTCEENWAGYFRRVTAEDPGRTAKETASFTRYGVTGIGRELWATPTAADPADTSFARWKAQKTGPSTDGSDDFRNVANTYGWVVEIDPFAPTSTPRKRTALGRFGHEGAWPANIVAGRPLVFYMGDDSRMEYIYKYVSTANWDAADATGGLAAGDKYLNDGKLYVAKFNADGTGTWLELRLGMNNITSAYAPYAFADQADVLVNARFAADAAGATKMDRPEWAAVNPSNGEVYVTLTNNAASARPLAQVDAANPRFYNDAKGTTAQLGNPNGHIVRFAEAGGDPTAATFNWDVFLFGARSTADGANVNVSALTAANDFSSPDGCWFSRSTGILWIETDDGAYTDVTNCMLLASIPGKVGDGSRKTITSTDGTTSKSVETSVGALPGDKLRRFLVGPMQCELTGVAETPDGKALFVQIQHPGEETAATNIGNPSLYGSHWPDGGSARPRSATLVITKNDGGTVGGRR